MTAGTEEDPTPGWDAITGALETLYPGQEPKHFGTVVSYALGGPDPLDGISVYRVEAPVPHWHYVSFGLSELYAKETDVAEVSGFGFELTFRLELGAEAEPPMFACNFLQNLARYVFESGRGFASGHHMDLNGPIEQGAETDITAICFATDPKLPAIPTPNGEVLFLQIVGITADELAAIKAWNAEGFLEVLERGSPLLTTALERKSILSDPQASAALRQGSRTEGSRTGTLFVQKVRVNGSGLLRNKVQWTLGATEVAELASVLSGRICHGNPLLLTDGTQSVHLVPGEAPGAKLGSDGLEIPLTPDLAERIASELKALRGNYAWPELPNLVVTVEPSKIRDHEGKVVKTVG